MPKTILTAWVKNVYTYGKLGGIKSVVLSPVSSISTHNTSLTVYNSPYLPTLIPVLSPHLSTQKNHVLDLLIHHLYPVSTAPIIKNKKER